MDIMIHICSGIVTESPASIPARRIHVFIALVFLEKIRIILPVWLHPSHLKNTHGFSASNQCSLIFLCQNLPTNNIRNYPQPAGKP